MNTPSNLPKLFSLIAVFALCLILFGTQTTLAQKTQTEIFVETLAQAENYHGRAIAIFKIFAAEKSNS